MAEKEDLVLNEVEYVIHPEVNKNGNDHLLFQGGECVTVVGIFENAEEVTVATVMNDPTEKSFLANIHPRFLFTHEEAHEQFVDHGDDEDEDEGSVVFEPHHPDYAWLPAYDALPLGYVEGLVRQYNGPTISVLYAANRQQQRDEQVHPLTALFFAAQAQNGFPTA